MVKKLVSWDEVLEALPPVVRAKLDELYLLKHELNTRTTPEEVHAIFAEDLDAWIGAAPDALDTLLELANALGNDPNFAETITAQIAGKADKVHTHKVDDITDFSTIGRALAKTPTAADARNEIGAGTSNLGLGNSQFEAMPGHRLQTVASLPSNPVAGVWYGIPQ